MIYLVDEDVVQLQSLVAVLEFRGLSVKQIDNADDALDVLKNAIDVDLVLIDVMLGTRDSASSQFTRVNTQDFLITGLELANKLTKSGNNAYPAKLAFLSMASRAHLVDQIKEKARELNVPYLDKRDIGKGIMEFVANIEKLVSKRVE